MALRLTPPHGEFLCCYKASLSRHYHFFSNETLAYHYLGEAARIQKCKGRVFALKDEPEASRLWPPNSDSPGLAMSRAFGDFCLKDYGLISVPDISYHRLTDKDKFIILATDGVCFYYAKESHFNL